MLMGLGGVVGVLGLEAVQDFFEEFGCRFFCCRKVVEGVVAAVTWCRPRNFARKICYETEGFFEQWNNIRRLQITLHQ